MIVWVLFVWLASGIPTAYTYETKGECERQAAIYKHASCAQVIEQKPK